MMQLRAPGPNPVRLSTVPSSAALKAWYETELAKLIEPMCADAAKALVPLYHSAPHPVQPITFPYGEMKYAFGEIEEHWQKKFDARALRLASDFAAKVLEYYDYALASALGRVGIGPLPPPAKKTLPHTTMDGDVEGHEFHGNQWTGGIGGSMTTESHHVDTNSADFKAWFADSKVTDASGAPLKLYRGGGSDHGREGFVNLEPSNNGDYGYKTVIFASANAEQASSFAREAEYEPEKPSPWSWRTAPLPEVSNPGGSVVPFYVKSTDVREFKLDKYSDGAPRFDKFRFDDEARRLGPGQVLVVRNVGDSGGHGHNRPAGMSTSGDQYAIGAGTSMKNALTNKGNYTGKTTTDGDVTGHEFHGNRWTGGIGGEEKSLSARITALFNRADNVRWASEIELKDNTTNPSLHTERIERNLSLIEEATQTRDALKTANGGYADEIAAINDLIGAHQDFIEAHHAAISRMNDVAENQRLFNAMVIGRAGMGEGHVGKEPIMMKTWMTPAQMDFVEVHNAIVRVAPTVGVRPERVLISTKPYNFEVGGHQMTAAGSASIYDQDPRITIYVNENNKDEKRLALVLAHESGHIIYEGALKEYRSEYHSMVNDPRITTEPRTSLLSPEGKLRNGGEKLYPVVAALALFHGNMSSWMREDCNTSNYAAEYQKAAREGRVMWESAYHEAFAETHAEAVSGSRPTGFRYSPVWNEYHKAVMKVQKEKNLAVDGDVEGHEFHGNQWTGATGEQGRCFANAAKWANSEEAPINAVVVHGTARIDTGKQLGHAWVEAGNRVIDPTAGYDGPKDAYYKMINAKPEQKYAPDHAYINALRSGHQGPWRPDEQYKKPIVDSVFGMDAYWDKLKVKFDFTDRLKQTAAKEIARNVSLIHSIPEQFHKRVRKLAYDSVEKGRDIKGFAKDLHDEFDLTLRRANFIARDQNNKITSAFHRVRRLDLGLSKAIWRHTAASLHPREEHEEFDGEIYDIEEGMYSDEAGENIWPGTEPCCGCLDETIIPGYAG